MNLLLDGGTLLDLCCILQSVPTYPGSVKFPHRTVNGGRASQHCGFVWVEMMGGRLGQDSSRFRLAVRRYCLIIAFETFLLHRALEVVCM